MNLTNEQIEKILNGAPAGATHVDHENDYWRMEDGLEPESFYECDGTWIPIAACEPLSSLINLREILTLRQEVERLKAEQSEVAARAIRTALRNLGEPSLHEDSIRKFAHDYANQLREHSDV